MEQKEKGQSATNCASCGRDIDAFSAIKEHIVPKNLGGTDEPGNLRYVCPNCNRLNAVQIAAKSFEAVSNPSAFAADIFIRAFESAPLKTAIFSFIASVAFFVSIFAIVGETNQQASPTFEQQISNLNDTEENLEALLAFVEQQRETVEAEQSALEALESERDRLRPLLEAERVQIDALFREQELRSAENAKRERWIGFGLGIIASLVASFVFAVGAYFLRRRALAGGDELDRA